MLLTSDNVSDLNFLWTEAAGRNKRYAVRIISLGLGRLTAYQTETIAMSILRDNADAATQLAKFRTADLSYALPGKSAFV